MCIAVDVNIVTDMLSKELGGKVVGKIDHNCCQCSLRGAEIATYYIQYKDRKVGISTKGLSKQTEDEVRVNYIEPLIKYWAYMDEKEVLRCG
jgi:hypothetical protein